MLKTYLNSPFLIIHATFLLFYGIAFSYALILRRRERRELRKLEADITGGTELRTITAAVETMSHRSTLKKQLKAALIASSQGAELQTQDVAVRVEETLSRADGIIRYCINGFVVVGLMGTLYAFYDMWRNPGSPQVVTNDLYLNNMARALSISFVGLALGLATSFLFSLLTTSRKALIADLSDMLKGLSNLIPLSSKTDLLMTRLLDPLDSLVKQLTIQNETVLKKMTATVDQRTEQLNKLINDTTSQWQTTLQEFKKETLTAVGSLQHSSATLADSSNEVAGTMREVTVTMKDVSQGLERTKDIALIVNQMEAASTSMVKRISERLEKATQASAKKLSSAVQEQRQALENQPKILEKLVKVLTAHAGREFKSVAGDVTKNLAHMSADFAAKTDAVGAKWMSCLAEGTSENRTKMDEMLEGWRSTVNSTTATVNTVLLKSDALIGTVLENMKLLEAEIRTLQAMVEELKRRAGAPLLLEEVSTKFTEVAKEFGTVNLNLESLVNNVTQNSDFGELHRSVESNSAAVKDVLETLKTMKPGLNGDTDLLERIDDINARLIIALAHLEEIGEVASELKQMN